MVRSGHGFSDWAWQRISAGLMLVYFIMLTVRLICDAPLHSANATLSYADWQAWCAPLWFKLASLIFAWALIYHAWIGVKEITMDYLHDAVLRGRVQFVCATLSWIYAIAISVIIYQI